MWSLKSASFCTYISVYIYVLKGYCQFYNIIEQCLMYFYQPQKLLKQLKVNKTGNYYKSNIYYFEFSFFLVLALHSACYPERWIQI